MSVSLWSHRILSLKGEWGSFNFSEKETGPEGQASSLRIAEKVCCSPIKLCKNTGPLAAKEAVCRNLERTRTKKSKSVFTVD